MSAVLEGCAKQSVTVMRSVDPNRYVRIDFVMLVVEVILYAQTMKHVSTSSVKVSVHYRPFIKT